MSASTASAAAESATTPGRLIKCRVDVTTEDGARHRYVDLFHNTCGAVLDALDRFGISKISVEAIKQ